MTKVSCSERIKQGLNIRGLKPADLCAMTEISRATMSQYVNGVYEPSQVRTEIISRALNVSEAWLMGYDVPMEREKPTTVSDDGLSELLQEPVMSDIFKLLQGLNPQNLELARAQLEAMLNVQGKSEN